MFGGFLAQSNDPIEISADALQWTERNGVDVFEYTGDVIARRGGMVIRAAILTAFQSQGGMTFDRIEASGNVSVVSGTQSATATSAVMDMVAQTIVMTGNVSLSDGPNHMSGYRFTVNLATGGWQLETTGQERVQTVINPPAR
jgi:lipopolysaccharide export system protein LptA